MYNRVDEPGRANLPNGANEKDGAGYPIDKPASTGHETDDRSSQQKRDYMIGPSSPQAVAIFRIVMITEHLLFSYSVFFEHDNHAYVSRIVYDSRTFAISLYFGHLSFRYILNYL